MNVAVLLSGNGSNLQALMDAAAEGRIDCAITAVISNRAEAFGLERARRAGVATEVVAHDRFASRERFDAALDATLARYAPGLVVLAGFMRILGAAFVTRYRGRLMNIHPSLLPAFPGTDTHERALAAGVKEHGASVHFVTEQLDAGPLIVQGRVPVMPDDSAETLATRVHAAEHRIYPLAVGWFADGRLRQRAGQAWLDGRPLQAPVAA